MENFNINRFWRTLCWYVLENKNSLFKWFVSFSLAFMAIGVLCMYALRHHLDDPGMVKVGMGQLVAFSSTIMFFSIILGISLVFSCITKKQRRTAFLMLPATNMEKYVSACIYAAVLVPLCIILAFIVGDTLRTLIYAAIGHGWHSGVKEMWEMQGSSIKNFGKPFVIILWLGSTYILGATLLRKAPFPIVSAVLLILLFSFPIIMVKYIQHVGPVSIPDYVKIVGALLLTVINYCVGYRLFKRFQLITSKWTNI